MWHKSGIIIWKVIPQLIGDIYIIQIPANTRRWTPDIVLILGQLAQN